MTGFVELEVEESDNFEKLIITLQGVTVENKYGKRYTVYIHTLNIDQFLRIIIEQNIHIKYISVQRYSLLDLFLKITGGRK